MDVACPNCGALNRNTSRFCAKCGQLLPRAESEEQHGREGLNLPWLQAVQERAVQQTGVLKPAQVSEEEPGSGQTDDAPATEAAQPTEPPAQEAAQAASEVAQPAPQTIEGSAQAGQAAETPQPATEGQPTEGAQPGAGGAEESPPDWVVGILEPGTSQASKPPPAPEQAYEPEEMEHIMPWLGDAEGAGEGGRPAEPGTPGLPPWLSGVTVQETLQATPEESRTLPNPGDLDLEGLEPFVPPELEEPKPAEAVPTPEKPPGAKEKVPDWVKSLTRQEPAAPVEAETAVTGGLITSTGLETTGALAGRGVGDIPVRPPRPGAVETLAALLQTPVGEAIRRPVPGAAGAASAETARRAGLRQWLLPDGIVYLLVLATLLAVLLVNAPFGEQNAPSAPDVLQFYSAVEAVPVDKPVLVVYDWDASRSAEMGALSEAITNHLMSRRLRFVTLSTVPQGPGFAREITAATQDTYGYQYGQDYLVLGYLPGNEAALGSLIGNLGAALPRDYINGLDAQSSKLARGVTLSSINDFALIIDLASDEAALRNWIEQVATRTRVPIVAAVPQALEPLARPYRIVAGPGLKAVVSGQAGALQYVQQMTQRGGAARPQSGYYTADRLARTLNAQSVAQILVALVIVAAFISLGVRRIFRR